MTQSFWAITSYFNPVGYTRRLENYHVFRKFLQAPLLTVEWSPNGDFQLQKDDADILVQLSGGDVMWQKERLLNVALRSLPTECDAVAWLDCDIVFTRTHWIVLALEKLGEFPIVQLFKTLRYAPGSLTPEFVDLESLDAVEPILTGNSLAFQLTGMTQGIEAIERDFNGQIDNGAWAVSKEMMLRHGFYDARIVGGGGMGIVKAAIGNYMEYVEERSLNPAQTAHYLAWAVPFFETVQRKISFIDGDVYHLWHGDLSNRQYRTRQQKLNEFEFDPFTDIAVGKNGCWHWNTNKPELHNYLLDYFVGRKEDGDESQSAQGSAKKRE